MIRNKSLILATFLSAASLCYWYAVRRPKTKTKRKRQNQDGTKNEPEYDPWIEKNHGEDTRTEYEIDALDPVIRNAFVSAANKITNLPPNSVHVSQEDKLILYALYKQATIGDCTISTTPSRFHVVAYAKYSAWNELKGLPKIAAMISYIELVQHLLLSHSDCMHQEQDENADIVYDDGDEEDILESSDVEDYNRTRAYDSKTSVMGLWHKQSTLLPTNEDDVDNEDDDGETCTMKRDKAIHGQQPIVIEEHTHQNKAEILNRRAMKALTQNDLSALQSCIDQGLNVFEQYEAGQTLLHFAADRGSFDFISTLLQAGADPNAADEDGISVLEVAVISGNNPNVVKLLLDAGADPDQQDSDGDSARIWAERDSNIEIKALFNK